MKEVDLNIGDAAKSMFETLCKATGLKFILIGRLQLNCRLYYEHEEDFQSIFECCLKLDTIKIIPKFK